MAVWRLLAEQEEEFSPERIGEQTVDVQVPQIAARDTLQERISEHTQNIDVPVMEITVPVLLQEEIIEVIKPFPAEHISERTVEQIVDIPVPQIQKQTVEVAKTTPQERFSERTVVQTEDVPVSQTLNEIVEVVKAVKTAHQAVHEPSFPSFQEEIDEMIKLFPEERVPKRIIQGFTPQERISERIHEQIADQPGDQARRDFADLLHFDTVEAISAPHERVQQRTVEHHIVEPTVDVPTPQILEEIVEAGSAPHDRVQQRTIILSSRLSMCQRLRSWKRSLRRVRPHMNECNSEPSSSRSLTPFPTLSLRF